MGEEKGVMRLFSRLCVPAALFYFGMRLFVQQNRILPGPFFAVFFEGLGLLTFVIAVSLAVALLIFRLIRGLPLDLAPLAFALAVGLFAFFAPLRAISIDYDFYLGLPMRTRFVEDVLSNKIRLKPVPPGKGVFQVPPDYGRISYDDRVLMETNGNGPGILFFFEPGLLGSFSGFLYRPDDSPPLITDFGGDLVYDKVLAPHWHLVGFN